MVRCLLYFSCLKMMIQVVKFCYISFKYFTSFQYYNSFEHTPVTEGHRTKMERWRPGVSKVEGRELFVASRNKQLQRFRSCCCDKFVWTTTRVVSALQKSVFLLKNFAV